jgi:hypothetical protein
VSLTRAWRAADVYLRKERIYVLSSQLHGDPVGRRYPGRDWGSLKSPPFIALDATTSDRDLGAAVLAAVDAASWVDDSVLDVSSPSAADDPLLKLAGVRSYRRFRRGLRSYIHVWENSGDFRLSCLGSQPFTSVVRVHARNPREDDLGVAVRDALAHVERYLLKDLAQRVAFVAFVVAPLALLLLLVVGLPLFSLGATEPETLVEERRQIGERSPGTEAPMA